eukprot:CAMPEP_0184857772 /NCGR_PEP_ID=MMETSP0580-20130426/2924_1 /TAXON_ID=1118495 /ORGANISM="Dactyliosolen fragilissimus" /LENGTH=188 /DNA_ID=CAMNT_0027353561 /DNA_START=237 /DNA_END=803 /DNA_ORIENTATION=+
MAPEHLLWGLLFLKHYSVETLHATVPGVSVDTFRKWAWIFVYQISYLEEEVIVWSNRYKGDTHEDCMVSVDGVDCRINGPSPYHEELSRQWYSYKFKGAGVRYEIAVSIKAGHIVWINGPYPCGSYPDTRIFKLGIMHYLDPGERVEADAGYKSLDPQYVKARTRFSQQLDPVQVKKSKLQYVQGMKL